MDITRRSSWMWAEACALLEEAERKHRRFFDLIATSNRPVWEPPTDIFADGAHVHVVVAVPGARVDQVTVQLGPSGLQIDATVSPPSLGSAANIVRLEIPYGRMRRRIELPPGRYVLSERRLDHGYLQLQLTREAP
jgi:HSP20 family molecular chaperone IbpA